VVFVKRGFVFCVVVGGFSEELVRVGRFSVGGGFFCYVSLLFFWGVGRKERVLV